MNLLTGASLSAPAKSIYYFSEANVFRLYRVRRKKTPKIMSNCLVATRARNTASEH